MGEGLLSVPLLAEDLLVVDGCWGKESLFFRRMATGMLSVHLWMNLCPHAYRWH